MLKDRLDRPTDVSCMETKLYVDFSENWAMKHFWSPSDELQHFINGQEHRFVEVPHDKRQPENLLRKLFILETVEKERTTVAFVVYSSRLREEFGDDNL